MSIDVDGNDYWIWKALVDYDPRVVVIEYNSSFPPNKYKVIKYNPKSRWDGTKYFGASLLALTKLAESRGYVLLGCEAWGINAFFVKKELIKENFELKNIKELYKPPRYGKKVKGKYIGHPKAVN